MLIGELAQQTGLSKDTIRFYEKKGLIESKAKQAGTRTYMDFEPEMLERVVMITQGKSLGFTLNEIKRLIDTWENGSMPTAEKLEVIDRKLDEITEKIQQLEQIRLYLNTKRDSIMQQSVNHQASASSRS